MIRKNLVVLFVLSTTLTSTAIALVLSHRDRVEPNQPVASRYKQTSQSINDQPTNQPEDLVAEASLPSYLRGPLRLLGDRLQKPGRERITLVGTVRRGADVEVTPFTLIWELPGRLRLDERGSSPQVTVFNGERVSRTGGTPNRFAEELLETLVYDSAEHLFVSQMQGAATRLLGTRFRPTEDSRADYRGAVFDVVEVTEPVATGRQASTQTRQYFFNSDTQVLEAVKYRVLNNNLETKVEVRLENWQRSNGQRFPGRVVRLENDAVVFALNVNPDLVTVGPKVDDGIFTIPN